MSDQVNPLTPAEEASVKAAMASALPATGQYQILTAEQIAAERQANVERYFALFQRLKENGVSTDIAAEVSRDVILAS